MELTSLLQRLSEQPTEAVIPVLALVALVLASVVVMVYVASHNAIEELRERRQESRKRDEAN